MSISTCCLGQNCTPSCDVEITDDGIIVTYQFHGGLHQEDPLHPGAKFWKIPGFGMNDVASEPAFPFHWDTFAIPDNVEVNVEVIDSASSDTLFTLAPAYPPLLMSDTIGYTPERVPAIAPYNGWFPNCAVKKGNIQNYRGQGIINVVTLPVQYDYYTQTVRSFSMIKYMVSFSSNGRRVKGRDYVSETADNNISITDHFLENTTLNYSLSNNGRKNIQRRENDRSGLSSQLDNRSYLIITTDDFLDAVNEFAEWKRTKGFNVLIESKQQGEWTPSDIKELIEYRYDQMKNSYPIYYLLIVGDIEYVPSESFSNENNHISDYYYGHRPLRYDTLFIHQGRIPIKSNLEAEKVFSKIIKYEQSPILDMSFYNNITSAAYFHERTYIQNHSLVHTNREHLNLVTLSEKIREYLSGNYTINCIYKADNEITPLLWYNGDSIPNILRKPYFAWNGNASDISNKINSGSAFFIYSGHGSVTSWSSLYFGLNHINQLENENKLPFIISRACKTGNFGNDNSCLAELFMTRENKGCVGITAATEVSYEDTNTIMLTHFIDGIWPGFVSFISNDSTGMLQTCNEPMYTLGDVFDYSVNKILESYSSVPLSGWSIYEAEIEHYFGDPSIMLYTNTPLSISNPNVTVRNDSIFVETTDGEARISMHTDFGNRYTKSFVGNYGAFKIRNGTNILCIDRHNHIPYIVKFIKDEFIQNETITDKRNYLNSSAIKIGAHVTANRPEGEV